MHERTHIVEKPNFPVYTITTITGDIRGAGTDANVFLTVFGKKGRTPKIQLSNGSDTFERGQTDVFKIKTNNLDPIQKIRFLLKLHFQFCSENDAVYH